jgi:hypothetical protein
VVIQLKTDLNVGGVVHPVGKYGNYSCRRGGPDGQYTVHTLVLMNGGKRSTTHTEMLPLKENPKWL